MLVENLITRSSVRALCHITIALFPFLFYHVQDCVSDSVEVDSSSHTGVATISVEKSSGKNRIIVAQGANKNVDAAFIRSHASAIENCRVTLAGMEVMQDAVIEALRRAKNFKRS